MPYKNKCFSICKTKTVSGCGKAGYCRTVRKYNRSGKSIRGYCKLSKKYRLSRKRTKTGKCRLVKKHRKQIK